MRKWVTGALLLLVSLLISGSVVMAPRYADEAYSLVLPPQYPNSVQPLPPPHRATSTDILVLLQEQGYPLTLTFPFSSLDFGSIYPQDYSGFRLFNHPYTLVVYDTLRDAHLGYLYLSVETSLAFYQYNRCVLVVPMRVHVAFLDALRAACT